MEDISNEFIQDTGIDFNENNDNFFEELTVEQKEWLKERIKWEANKLMTSSKTV